MVNKKERIDGFQKNLAIASACLLAARDAVSPLAVRTRKKLEQMAAFCEMLIDRAQDEREKPCV